MDLAQLKPEELPELSDEQLAELAGQVLNLQRDDRKENQLRYYKPVSKTAEGVHLCRASVVGIGGGNRSSKTETALVDACMDATGVYPDWLKAKMDVHERFRGPLNVRIVCESLTTTLHQTILSKLKWWLWTGLEPVGGDRGHWGWIPKDNLINGDWNRSWSEKYRTLRVLCRDPDDPNIILGESIFQAFSHDQDPSDFASGSCHIVLHDEPTRYSIWRENRARTMDVAGRMFLVMTWPDDPSIPVDWIFDEVYEPGKSGKDPDIAWFELYTTDNPFLDQRAIAAKAAQMSNAERKVRIKGQPIRFSNRIHPLFTDLREWWCFKCGNEIIPLEGKCPDCGGEDITHYQHVKEFPPVHSWPTIYVLDPHPRKPHMMMWVQVDPSDDYWQVAELEVADDPVEVRKQVDRLERSYKLYPALRIMDPNMGASPAGARRGISWQDEFSAAGLHCDLADDSDVGRGRINEYLKPDRARYLPRMQISESCPVTIRQFKRYTWDEFKRSDRDAKQTPKEKDDDYPTMWKYLMNELPTFRTLRGGVQILQTRGRR